MSFLTIIYIVVLLLGVLWVIHRVRIFLRAQKERETMWDQVMSPEELRAYVENVKRESESSAPEPDSAGEKKSN